MYRGALRITPGTPSLGEDDRLVLEPSSDRSVVPARMASLIRIVFRAADPPRLARCPTGREPLLAQLVLRKYQDDRAGDPTLEIP
jgi:hypothetical protein